MPLIGISDLSYIVLHFSQLSQHFFDVACIFKLKCHNGSNSLVLFPVIGLGLKIFIKFGHSLTFGNREAMFFFFFDNMAIIEFLDFQFCISRITLYSYHTFSFSFS